MAMKQTDRLEQRLEDAERISAEEIVRRLIEAKIPVKKDTWHKNNVGYLAKLQAPDGTWYWTTVKTAYKKLIEQNKI